MASFVLQTGLVIALAFGLLAVALLDAVARGGECSSGFSARSVSSGYTDFINDAFRSNFRKNRESAAQLEKALRDHKPPKGLTLTKRNLVVFRHEADFTGAEHREFAERHVKSFARTAVIFSPETRKGNYVSGEICHLGGC